MWRLLLILPLLLAGCSKGAEADLPAIGEAGSLGAEWALVNEQANKGRLTQVYVATMRKQLRDQLQTTLASLAQPQSPYGDQIRVLLGEPDDAPPDQLRQSVLKLKQIEDSLESA
jgi:hypothetical protein